MSALTTSTSSDSNLPPPPQVGMESNQDQSTDMDEETEATESQIPRAVSPVPTEILEDPPVEEIMADLQSKGIKVRDFGTPEAINATRQQFGPVTEIFDPYRGIAEFEYRLESKKVTRRPVTGKTLRRLLNLGWVTQQEMNERCEEMDREALREYDERVEKDVNEGRGVYPWRALRWTHIPTRDERSTHVLKHALHFAAIDKARKYLEELERRDRVMREEAEADQKLAQEFMERQRREEEEKWAKQVEEQTRAVEETTTTMTRKRSLTDADMLGAVGEEDHSEGGRASPKRIRLSPELTVSPAQSQDAYYPAGIIPPEKQYPAPLSSYDPKLYPDAAVIIGSQSQSQKQYPDPTPPGTPREGTPPVEEKNASTPYGSPMRMQKMKRGRLARTETLTCL